MTKHLWKHIGNHIDPEKEEELKWAKTEIESQVKRVIKLTKSMSHGNKEKNTRNKSEAINIVEDFQKQYESLYSLYEDLREQVKKNVQASEGDVDNNNSSPASNSDSESFYSPRGSNSGRAPIRSNSFSKGSDSSRDSSEPDQTSDLDDTILKDKLTCSSQVKEITDLVLQSESGEMLKDLRVRVEESQNIISPRVKDFKGHVESLELEISKLCMENKELKEQVEYKSNEAMEMKDTISRLETYVSEIEAKLKEIPSSLVKSPMEHVNSLEDELKPELEKISEDISAPMIIIENLKNEPSLIDEHSLTEEKEGLTTQVYNLESKIRFLLTMKSKLEMQLNICNHDASQLQNSLSEKENELSTENLMSTKTEALSEEIKNLKSELKNEKKRFNKAIETEKNRLQSDLDKEKEEYFSPSKFLVEKISKSNFQDVEKKVDEMLEEYRKQVDDKYRILSRRIRVAEQLQVENKEWYHKTKEAFEQQNQDLKNRAERNEIDLQNIKDMALAVNHVLTSLDSVALNFEECSANFLNRISKASCELKFAKHWAKRKNKAVLHVKDDLDCLLAQLDDKEAEILVFREKVWKSENKVRELEKMVKEKEDGMLGLMEEKREAIRQLCIWIDYHRGRSDHYMKMLSEMNLVRFTRGRRLN